jgi:predicted 3-demethylubiquinone-9 3-methyltransferase (glyoxalase superfamily)
MVEVRSHLWFDDDAHEAAAFYVSLVPGSEVTSVTTAPEGVPDVAPGTPFVVELTLAGVPYTFLNAGPAFRLDEAFSIMLTVDTQDEVDRYWAALTADGGRESQCGWLVDRFGVSWQVVPRGFAELMSRGDAAGVARAMAAMMTMTKLDLPTLEAAYATG